MDNKKYLNEESYQKNKKSVNKVGTILICVGIMLLLTGIICIIFEVFGGVICFPIGMACLGFGAQAKMLGHGREINAFLVQQQMPVAKEGINEMAPSVGKAAKEIAKEVTKGIKEGMADSEE